MKKKTDKTPEQLRAEIDELKIRLQEAEDTIQAIREGAVDAVVVAGPKGEQIFTLSGEDVVYRQLVETMQEAGLTTTPEGRILFCNKRFAVMVQQPMERIIGRRLDDFVAPFDHSTAIALLVEAQVRPARKRIVFQASGRLHVPTSVAANLLQQAGPPKICIVAADLTELEVSEQALEETEAQKQALEENAAALRQSRQAALNLMEEAVAAREEAERLTEQLKGEIAERKQAEEEFRETNEELMRFNKMAVGRELRMIELKKEVNYLCGLAGQEPRYALEFEKKNDSEGILDQSSEGKQ